MTDCGRCGDCCDRIGYFGDWNRLQQWADYAKSWREWAMYNLRDGEDGGLDEYEARMIADSEFILAHWSPNPDEADAAMPSFKCSAFDPVARLCTAHNTRPPICRGFPWYGERSGVAHSRLPARCSFWADVPLENRPGAGLKLLPVLNA